MAIKVGELIAGSPTVASLPSAYARLTEVMADPYSSTSDVAAVVSEDPGLTVRILRLVNSAMFGFPSRIESVAQALSVVGTEQVHDLALATSVIKMFKNVPEEFVDMDSFWSHSLACGVCARVFATQQRAANVERFFVAGLLHDIGRLLMYTNIPDDSRAVFERSRDQNELLYIAERECLGFDHATVGHALLREWKLPESLVQPVAHHHTPDRAGQFSTEASIVHIADIVAHSLLFGNGGERFVPPLSDTAWDVVQVDTISYSLISEIDSQYSAAAQAILRTDAT